MTLVQEQTFSFYGTPSEGLADVVREIEQRTAQLNMRQIDPKDGPKLVFHFVDGQPIRALRRDKSKPTWTFSAVVAEAASCPGGRDETLSVVYPLQLRAFANVGILIHRNPLEAHITTLEQGHYIVPSQDGSAASLVDGLLERLEPMVFSRFVIATEFTEDLPEELWDGNETTEAIYRAGKQMDTWGLLPAPYPVENYLTDHQMRYLRILYGIGGLSYGNISARAEGDQFWMSATGVDKSNLRTVGKDVLWVKGYDEQRDIRVVSIPPGMKKPSWPSVDLIEHYMIYTQHPDVGAIVHAHGWMDGVVSTEFNYPCGTVELGKSVADLISAEPDPSRAVVGLRNHGLTITGTSLDDIMSRIDGKIRPQVPMS